MRHRDILSISDGAATGLSSDTSLPLALHSGSLNSDSVVLTSEDLPQILTQQLSESTNGNISLERVDKFSEEEMLLGSLEISNNVFTGTNEENIISIPSGIIQSTPRFFQSPTRPTILTNTKMSGISSDEELFGSVTQISFSMINDDTSHINDNMNGNSNVFDLHKKICVFTDEKSENISPEIVSSRDNTNGDPVNVIPCHESPIQERFDGIVSEGELTCHDNHMDTDIGIVEILDQSSKDTDVEEDCNPFVIISDQSIDMNQDISTNNTNEVPPNISIPLDTKPFEVATNDNQSIFEIHQKICLFTNEDFDSASPEVNKFKVSNPISIPNMIDNDVSPLPIRERLKRNQQIRYREIATASSLAKEAEDKDSLETRIPSSSSITSIGEPNRSIINPKRKSNKTVNKKIPRKNGMITRNDSSLSDTGNEKLVDEVNVASGLPIISRKRNLSSSYIEGCSLVQRSPKIPLKRYLTSSDADLANLSFSSSSRSSKKRDSILPLLQRISANNKAQDPKSFISISSDEEPANNIVSEEKIVKKPKASGRNSKKSDPIKPDKPPVKRKSKDTEKKKIEKSPMKLKLKPDRAAPKRKPKDYESPAKQKFPFNPFTPMPDYRSMPIESLDKQCVALGLKSKLSKTKTILILEELFRHTHQIDDDDDKTSSSDSANDASVRDASSGDVSTDSKEEEDKPGEELENNVDFYRFLKDVYFDDILTYKVRRFLWTRCVTFVRGNLVVTCLVNYCLSCAVNNVTTMIPWLFLLLS